MKFETQRLIIREFTEDDLEDVQTKGSRSRVSNFMQWSPNEELDTEAFIKSALSQQNENPRKGFNFAIERKKNGIIIGGLCFRIRSERNRDGEFGYALRSEDWGKGYGTESAIEIVKFGFEKLKMHRIHAMVDPENLPSEKILKKIGMTKEGRLRKNFLVRGDFKDSLLYSILEEEFFAKNRT